MVVFGINGVEIDWLRALRTGPLAEWILSGISMVEIYQSDKYHKQGNVINDNDIGAPNLYASLWVLIKITQMIHIVHRFQGLQLCHQSQLTLNDEN